MLEIQLLKLGFSTNEIKVYLSLFELGKVRAKEIIDLTGLHRNIVYTALEELVKRELVTKTSVGGVAEYVANEPDNLVREIEQKKELARQVAEELKKKQIEKPREITVYEGFEGVKKSREKVFNYKKGDEMYILGASTLSSTPEYEKYWRKFHDKREKLGIGLKILYEHNIKKEDVEWRKQLPLTKVKYLPPGLDSPVWFSAIGEYLEIGVPGDNPLVFNIRSQQAVEGVKKYFEYFWNQEVVVETGLVAVEKFIYSMLDELKPGEEYFALGASVGMENEAGQKLYDRFHRDRIKKGVVTNMLVYKESYDLIKKRFEKSGDPEGKVSRLKVFVNAPKVPTQINIYNNKVRFIIYDKEPVVIYFERPEIYFGFKAYFDALWIQQVKIHTSYEAIEDAYNSILEKATKDDEIVVFAAKPQTARSADFNLDWMYRISKKAKGISFIYYGDNDINRHRVKDVQRAGGKTRIIPAAQNLPISSVVFRDTVLNTVWGKDQSMCFEVQDKTVAESLRGNFELLWQQESYVISSPEAVRDMWLEAVEAGELLFIGARGYFIDKYPKMFAEVVVMAKKKVGVKWKNVTDEGVRGHYLTTLPWVETKYVLPKAPSPNVVWLYGSTVAVANWSEDQPIIFVSKNPHLVQSYRDYFNTMWTKK
jgi:sugar-specific transcriptional regulator TrmB